MLTCLAAENYLRSYVEPTTSKDTGGNAGAIVAGNSIRPPISTEDRPPLPDGSLAVNLGVSIAVVCTKVRLDAFTGQICRY